MDENRSLSQQMGSIGQKERVLTEKLAESSKEFDDLVVRFESMRATYNIGEWRLRDEVLIDQVGNMELHVQMERAGDEVNKIARVLKDRAAIISLHTSRIDHLERSSSSGEIRHGPI